VAGFKKRDQHYTMSALTTPALTIRVARLKSKVDKEWYYLNLCELNKLRAATEPVLFCLTFQQLHFQISCRSGFSSSQSAAASRQQAINPNVTASLLFQDAKPVE
jgi:hypothetical protein